MRAPRWRELVARAYIIPYIINTPHTLANFQSLTKFYPCWRELVARAYHNSLYNQCAPHFGKLSEFAKVLSFGASRTGFYRSLILRLSFAYPSSHTRLCQLADFPSLKVRWECELVGSALLRLLVQ